MDNKYRTMKPSIPNKTQNDTLQDTSDKTIDKPNENQSVEEIGGRKGPEPTRYGDWEKGGRCIDF